MANTLDWKQLASLDDFNALIEHSKTKPALVFKHRPSSEESTRVLDNLEENWTLSPEDLDLYMVDVMKAKDVSSEVTEAAGVINEFPQVLLFADGVTMYDESHELINVKKIKLALKIIGRTFKWMETRV